MKKRTVLFSSCLNCGALVKFSLAALFCTFVVEAAGDEGATGLFRGWKLSIESLLSTTRLFIKVELSADTSVVGSFSFGLSLLSDWDLLFCK